MAFGIQPLTREMRRMQHPELSETHSRYSRQHLFAPIGITGQQKLGAARVAVVGAGALGTVISNHMVRAGVGFTRIIDRDIIEWSNLQRQTLYDEADAAEAKPKALAAAEKLSKVNSQVQIEPMVTDLTAANAERLLRDVDLILDGTDNFATRFLINDVAVLHRLPWIYAGAVASRGMVAPFLPDGPCFRCLFPDDPDHAHGETCDTVGVIGPLTDIVGSLASTLALKCIVGAPIARTLTHLDVWEGRQSTMKLPAKQENCSTCGRRIFSYLHTDRAPETVSLCGRDTIQVTPNTNRTLSLDALAKEVRAVAQSVTQTPFFVRVMIDTFTLTVFSDGRALIQGTSDTGVARSLYARYVGT